MINPLRKLRPKTVYRALEIIPGAMVWATLVGCIILSIVKPVWAIMFIIVFDLYWLMRVVYLIIFIIS